MPTRDNDIKEFVKRALARDTTSQMLVPPANGVLQAAGNPNADQIKQMAEVYKNLQSEIQVQPKQEDVRQDPRFMNLPLNPVNQGSIEPLPNADPSHKPLFELLRNKRSP